MRWLPLFLLLFSSFCLAESTRFPADSLGFVLIENDGVEIGCRHQLLAHVPWWRVDCGDRQYTVDIWLQRRVNPGEGLTRLSLMYHASEGVQSSGEKLVQFKSHWSHFDLVNPVEIKRIGSELDVRNGQAWLRVEVSLESTVNERKPGSGHRVQARP